MSGLADILGSERLSNRKIVLIILVVVLPGMGSAVDTVVSRVWPDTASGASEAVEKLADVVNTTSGDLKGLAGVVDRDHADADARLMRIEKRLDMIFEYALAGRLSPAEERELEKVDREVARIVAEPAAKRPPRKPKPGAAAGAIRVAPREFEEEWEGGGAAVAAAPPPPEPEPAPPTVHFLEAKETKTDLRAYTKKRVPAQAQIRLSEDI